MNSGTSEPDRLWRRGIPILGLTWIVLLLWGVGPASAQEPGASQYGRETSAPPAYQLRSERGDLFRITNEKIFTGPAPDRIDICFALASHIINPKIFVFDNSRTFYFDGGEAGLKCLTRYTGFDYESFDLGRKRRTRQGLRGRSFGRRAVLPQATDRRVDFYEGPQIRNTNRIFTQVLTFYPGYKTTILWLVDGSGEPLEKSLVD